jgi:hypothetical protein
MQSVVKTDCCLEPSKARPDIPGSLDMNDWLRACNQLADYNLIGRPR